MKILHTSDWHLGHTLYGHDRTEEQTEMLRQMADIVRDEKPDVFLLCGDVYHTPQPSAAVQTMFANAMVAIHDANPDMTIIITAGNHDSAAKHEIFSTPWKALKVYAIGTLCKDSPGEHIIKIADKGYVAAVPYTYEKNMPEDFFQQALNAAAEMNTESLPIVMTAHLTVRGCDYAGHDNGSEYSVGGIDSFDIGQMGCGYDYLALGHIHHQQFIHPGRHNARYSGSPMEVSFDERYAHSVSIVEIKSHGDTPEVRTIDIANPHPLVTLPADGYASWDEAKALLTNFPSDIPAYIRLNVMIDDFLPAEANAEANALTEGKLCRFCCINARRKEQAKTGAKAMTVQEFQAEKPIDIAKRYAEDIGSTFDDEMTAIFREAMDRVADDSRNE